MKELLVILKDIHGEFSGKRILGTLCVLVGLILTGKASFFCQDKLSEQAIIIAPLFATGLAFWGITSYFDKKNQTIDNGTEAN